MRTFSEQQSAEFLVAFQEAMFSTNNNNDSSERENVSSSPDNIQEEMEVEMQEEIQKDGGIQEENTQDDNTESTRDLASTQKGGSKRKGK